MLSPSDGSTLYDQVKAAYHDQSPESYQFFEQLSRLSMETMGDEEWFRLCTELRENRQTQPGQKLSLHLEVKPADLWIGCYWKRQAHMLHLWICFIPCIPLHITIHKGTH